MAEYHVHVVFDAADPYPISVCGIGIVPGIWLPGPVLLCRRCLADVHDAAELRPASHLRRRTLENAPDGRAGLLLALCRRYLAGRYDRQIRRAAAREWRRG